MVSFPWRRGRDRWVSRCQDREGRHSTCVAKGCQNDVSEDTSELAMVLIAERRERDRCLEDAVGGPVLPGRKCLRYRSKFELDLAWASFCPITLSPPTCPCRLGKAPCCCGPFSGGSTRRGACRATRWRGRWRDARSQNVDGRPDSTMIREGRRGGAWGWQEGGRSREQRAAWERREREA